MIYDPIGAFTVKAIFAYDALSPAGKAAWQAKAAARHAAIVARGAITDQVLDIERHLRNINPLPAAHPARALEDGLIAQAEQLRAEADAIVIPPHPNAYDVAVAIEKMWRR
jgi:hypothetical protein